MNCLHATYGLIRKIALLALLGLVVVFLGPPILALAAGVFSVVLGVFAALLPFVLAGLLIGAVCQLPLGNVPWRSYIRGVQTLGRFALIHAVRAGIGTCAAGIRVMQLVMAKVRAAGPVLRDEVGGRVYSLARFASRKTGEMVPVVAGVVARSVPLAVRAWDGVHSLLHAAVRGAMQAGPVAGTILLETLCGASVGALLVAVGISQFRGAEVPLALGAAFGAMLGLGLGVSRALPTSRATV